jgi:hypothetical protein
MSPSSYSNQSSLFLPVLAKDYCGGVGIASGELVVAVVLQVSPMVLVEALEAVIEVDGCSEGRIEREGDPAWRIGGVIGLVFAGVAGVVVAEVDFLGVGGGFDEDESDGDADGACVGGGVLRMT